MSSDETSIYALSSDGQFSAWSFIQTSQKMFEVQLNDPYFSSDAYSRAAYGKQFAFAGKYINISLYINPKRCGGP